MTHPSEAARLYVALGNLVRSLRRAAPQSDLGHASMSALAAIASNGPMRAGELAAHEGVSGPSMTRVIGVLEDLGYARRSPDPSDGRVAVIDLTDRGRTHITEGREQRLSALNTRIEALSDDQRAALFGAVEVLEILAR